MVERNLKVFFMLLVVLIALTAAGAVFASSGTHEAAAPAAVETPLAATAARPASTAPWWIWPLALFIVTFILGILAVLGGVGGGVLFVPIVGGFFPFHIDFVRGAGLLVALAGALAAGHAETEVHYSEAPLGVAYLVATLIPR